MTIRVNEVIIIRIAGATESTVSIAKSCSVSRRKPWGRPVARIAGGGPQRGGPGPQGGGSGGKTIVRRHNRLVGRPPPAVCRLAQGFLQLQTVHQFLETMDRGMETVGGR